MGIRHSKSKRARSGSAKDERLARKLAREEEKKSNKHVEKVKDNLELGIVFSVVLNPVDNTLDDGSPARCEDLERFRPWKELCEQSGCPEIVKFHWFVNYELEKRFELARNKLENIMGQQLPERQLFHGTAAANVKKILSHGFKIGGVGGHPVSHGTSQGYGVYLGSTASLSLSYALGTKKILACRVILGRTTTTPIRQPPSSSDVGSESFECYDGNGIFVHRYPSLVLPCYVIEFK